MDLGYPADHDFSDICGKFNNFLINFDACLDETTEEGAKWKDSTGTHFDRVLLMRMHTNLMDEQIYLNVEKDWNKLWNFFKLVPIQIQRRGLRGFSKPKIEGFAVPKTVNFLDLAALIIANKPGLADSIIANRLALWVIFNNEYRKGSDFDHSGKIGKEILYAECIQTDGNRAFNFKDHL